MIPKGKRIDIYCVLVRQGGHACFMRRRRCHRVTRCRREKGWPGRDGVKDARGLMETGGNRLRCGTFVRDYTFDLRQNRKRGMA